MSRSIALAMTLSFATAAPAFASIPAASQVSPAQRSMDHDFGKVSADGFNAFADIRMARIAIFNGNTAGARSAIANAATALAKAKTDDSIFVKAEAELKAPQGITQPNPANAAPDTASVKWLPIDGAMTLGEDYAASPAKAASVAKANTELKSGDHAHAMETLKLAAVDVTFDEEVAPLDKTIAGVDKARQLADAGQYFEANQALKGVQDGIRFDEQDYAGALPKAYGQAAPANADAKTAKN